MSEPPVTSPSSPRLAETMAEAGVDFMAVSFVRTAADIEQVRDVVGTFERKIAR